MVPREIVIDGTDGAGKSPLVSKLVTTLSNAGLRVGTQAPYRVREVYPLWESDSIRAASTIVGIMQTFRSQHPGVDVIVWDRGWPTAYVSTTSEQARALFLPFPDLTILLLNRDRPELAKRHEGSAAVWLTDAKLRERYQAAYRRLPAEVEALSLWVFHAGVEGHFDLEVIANQVTRWMEPRRVHDESRRTTMPQSYGVGGDGMS